MNIDHELAKISRAVRRLGLRHIRTEHTPAGWAATFDGYEPGEPIGYGATQRDAIIDLLQQDAE